MQKYKLVDVTVEGAEIIRSWPSEEENFLKANAVDPETANRIRTEPAFQFPPLQEHFRQALNAKIKAEVMYLAGPIFPSGRPVKAVVRLRTFDIPSTARRVFVDSQAKIQADIDIVDKATGNLILRYPGRLETRKLIGGLATGIAVAFEGPDLGYSMITDYLSAYRNWLLHN
ncbi:hypothetical protein [Microvirga terricola]|uniref:Uncharacterized protein n=1 Tax=Microvirga terricola TaxID=2719797 RepID=A0ABX0V9W4_9HYPH|nr:hypothetical protein [Microvirga terricola]NIX76628.1 hypothetical protein [Microvirga terricola]